MQPLIDNPGRISLQSPYELRTNSSVRLSVYLYRIVEDAYCKNQFPVPGLGLNLRRPPLTLDLYYLVTPLIGLPREQQIVLGKVMQVFYDRAILSGLDLAGGLAGSDERIRIALNPVSLGDDARLARAGDELQALDLLCGARRLRRLDARALGSAGRQSENHLR